MTIWGGLPTQMDKTRGGAVRCGAVLWTSWSTAPRRHQKREGGSGRGSTKAGTPPRPTPGVRR
eukprot:CAMPEP_0174320450 /NCGR_PEP_ID=MMETSP0810-20121108/9560_1 /TAXON_ID=73025 ORGANISM="Eutreptiella gymnastica-like, Strain CCMP1594" /NCGR_SAMPLE_ID=MMETSP0810 /ASSEMBLY_ACC=CAM_ASM_000659 /LENGTH=62 /DNA_ID=CAMNT_0015431371 /DNA_START=310 /DNA_END=495 /DNA_ORIENTATION=-